MKKNIFLIAAFSLLLDQVIKYVVSYNEINKTIINNFLSIIYTKNRGVAFSLFSGNVILIIVFSIVLLAVLFHLLKKDYLNKKVPSLNYDIAYGILFAGIFGNLLDRIIKGYVVDYVSLKIFGYYFPIFNLADLLITVGIIMLLIFSFKEEKKLKNKNS